MRMDQATAWLLGIFIAASTFVVFYFTSKWVGARYAEKQEASAREKIAIFEKMNQTTAKKLSDVKTSEIIRTPGKTTITQDDRWGYAGSLGPNYWPELHPDFKKCGSKVNQSPVDIQNFEQDQKLKPLEFKYKLNDVTLQFLNGKISGIVSPGSYMVFDGDAFDLKTLTFKTPSEHWIKGLPYEAEMQLKHADSSGREVILSILLLAYSKNFSPSWEIPKFAAQDSVMERQDVTQFFPRDRKFYHYQGSSTEPPCEEARWLIFTEPKSIDKKWIDRLVIQQKNAARSIQPLGSRHIRHSVR